MYGENARIYSEALAGIQLHEGENLPVAWTW